jgi:hypothetical protein
MTNITYNWYDWGHFSVKLEMSPRSYTFWSASWVTKRSCQMAPLRSPGSPVARCGGHGKMDGLIIWYLNRYIYILWNIWSFKSNSKIIKYHIYIVYVYIYIVG